MPKVRWGINASSVDEFDRESQFTPYRGPTPPNGVYEWSVKQLKHVAGTREKHPQLRIGLELIPREGDKAERAFKGYFTMVFRSITEKSAPFYVPFLDAIGVSGRDFTERTITDEDGNIKKIGSWRNDGKQTILGQLKDDVDQNGKPRKEIGWMGPVTEEEEDYDDEDAYDDEELSDDEYDDDDGDPF